MHGNKTQQNWRNAMPAAGWVCNSPHFTSQNMPKHVPGQAVWQPRQALVAQRCMPASCHKRATWQYIFTIDGIKRKAKTKVA
jgi:hypothetical protein